MEKMLLHRITLTLLVFLLLSVYNFASEHRSKRFLLLQHKKGGPKANIHIGIGFPVHVDLESVTIGYGFTAKYVAISNASQIWTGITHPFVEERSIEKRETPQQIDYEDENEHEYDSAADDENETNNLASMRWTVYKMFAGIAESHGFPGRSCVLRSICESAHTPFDYESGILGELFHVVMSPSLTTEEIHHHEDNEYLYAESMGKKGAPCERIFNECKTSFLDFFARIETML